MELIKNWLNKSVKDTNNEVKNWHVLVFSAVLLFALIGESVINNLIP
jgi:hypothetical protein